MVRFFRAVTVMAVFILYPAQASANAVLPWFDATEITSPLSDQGKKTTTTKTKKPQKRMLAMSIGGAGKGARTAGTTQSSGCPLAVLVSLVGLIGIGTLTRKDPMAESEKVL